MKKSSKSHQQNNKSGAKKRAARKTAEKAKPENPSRASRQSAAGKKHTGGPKKAKPADSALDSAQKRSISAAKAVRAPTAKKQDAGKRVAGRKAQSRNQKKPVRGGAVSADVLKGSGASKADPLNPIHENLDESYEPVKAYKNLPFLNSAAARHIRVQCEMTEPGVRFARNKIHHTLVFFGSARSVTQKEADSRLKAIRAEMKDAKAASRDQIKRLDEAERLVRLAPYHDMAIELARLLTEWSMSLEQPSKRFYICSGGGPGMMEAANQGASEAGGKSIGLGISLPFEQSNNPYISQDLSFEFHYFFVRKYWFLFMAKALVVFPGGFGTFDELFEMLTLVQTRKTTKHLPVVLMGSSFWNEVINFPALVDWGVISREDLDLFRIFDNAPEAAQYLIDDLTRHTL